MSAAFSGNLIQLLGSRIGEEVPVWSKEMIGRWEANLLREIESVIDRYAKKRGRRRHGISVRVTLDEETWSASVSFWKGETELTWVEVEDRVLGHRVTSETVCVTTVGFTNPKPGGES